MARPEKVRRVLLDASCLIGVIQGEAEMLCLRSLLAAVDRGDVKMVASTGLLAEVLPSHPQNQGKPANEAVGQLLEAPETELVDINVRVARKAADYRIAYGLKTWDAVHLATAVLAECDLLLVRDDRFPYDTEVEGVWVSRPYDIEGEHLLNLPEQ